MFHIGLGPEKHKEIVTLLGGYFSRGPGIQPCQADGVKDNFGVVFLSPLLDVGIPEPLIVTRNEMDPLEHLEFFLFGRTVTGKDQSPGADGRCPHHAGFDELPSGNDAYPFLFQPFCTKCHGDSSFFLTI